MANRSKEIVSQMTSKFLSTQDNGIQVVNAAGRVISEGGKVRDIMQTQEFKDAIAEAKMHAVKKAVESPAVRSATAKVASIADAKVTKVAIEAVRLAAIRK